MNKTGKKEVGSEFDLAITGGRVIDPESKMDRIAEIFIRDGVIKRIPVQIAARILYSPDEITYHLYIGGIDTILKLTLRSGMRIAIILIETITRQKKITAGLINQMAGIYDASLPANITSISAFVIDVRV